MRLEAESRLELRVESVPVDGAVNTAQRPRSHSREAVAVVTRHHSSREGVMSVGRHADEAPLSTALLCSWRRR